MKKIVSILVLLTLLLGATIGCTKKEEAKQNVPEKKQEEVKPNLDRLKEEFKKEGLEVGDNENVAFDMLGANNGYKFKLNGELIEIYEYNLNALSENGNKFVEQAKNGSVTMSGFNIPVKYNDGIMITRYDEHKDKDKILEIFNKFK